MPAWRAAFQCPDTGQTVIASYAFGKVTIRAVSEDGEDIMSETEVWCRKHTNRRCEGFDAANDYVIKISEEQSFGLEEITS